MTYVLEYNVAGFGWDHEDCYDLEEVKSTMERLKEDYGKDTRFKVWQVSKKQIPLKDLK